MDEGRVVRFVSDAAHAALGYAAVDLTSHDVLTVVHPDVWAAIGSLVAPAPMPMTPSRLSLVPIALMILSLGGAFRSTTQIIAMESYGGGRAELERASRLDPGNYRIHMRLANRCEHARAAAALFPTSQPARNAARKCR